MFHILVVDDDKNTRQLIKAVLETENYIVIGATDGEDALKVLDRSHIDLVILVILDVMMPKMDGYEFTEILRRVQNELPILMVSAKQLPADRNKGFIVGEVILDYDSLTVKRKNTCQELPQKEFMLLYKLLSYPGKIFTRIQLMDEIWGVDSDTGWETVTVHVARLRKRFEDWPEFEIISVRGLGYKAVRNDES